MGIRLIRLPDGSWLRADKFIAARVIRYEDGPGVIVSIDGGCGSMFIPADTPRSAVSMARKIANRVDGSNTDDE